MSVTGYELMPTLEDTILQGLEGWSVIVIPDCFPMQAIELKNSLIQQGLEQDQDFRWGYRSSEYDGFTMNRPRHAAFAFRDPAMASFFRLKWA